MKRRHDIIISFLCYKTNFKFYYRHLSHVAKSRIFKNLNLRRKDDWNFRSNSVRNQFRHLRLYLNPYVDWQDVPIWELFERQKVEVHIFVRVSYSGFAMWKFTTKEDLNPQKQIFLLNLRLCLLPSTKTQNNLVCIVWEKVYIRNFSRVKARGFQFQNYYFPPSPCWSYPCHKSSCITITYLLAYNI